MLASAEGFSAHSDEAQKTGLGILRMLSMLDSMFELIHLNEHRTQALLLVTRGDCA